MCYNRWRNWSHLQVNSPQSEARRTKRCFHDRFRYSSLWSHKKWSHKYFETHVRQTPTQLAFTYEKEIYNEKFVPLFFTFSFNIIRLLKVSPSHRCHMYKTCAYGLYVVQLYIVWIFLCFEFKVVYAISLKGCVTKDAILTSCNYITEARSKYGRFTAVLYTYVYYVNVTLYTCMYFKILLLFIFIFHFFPHFRIKEKNICV